MKLAQRHYEIDCSSSQPDELFLLIQSRLLP